MPQFLRRFGDGPIGQYSDPGYFHPSGPFVEAMVALEERPKIRYLQPTSGTTCFVDSVRVTVLTPGIGPRGRFDTYGVAINDGSLAVKIEFPASRVARGVQRDPRFENRSYLNLDEPLGAAARWWRPAHRIGAGDHRLETGAEPRTRRTHQTAVDSDLLRGRRRLLQLPAPAHRRGHPRGPGPHRSSHRSPPAHDWKLGIQCTGAFAPVDGDLAAAGSLAVLIPRRRGQRLRVWRFLDAPRDRIDLSSGRKLTQTY